MAYEAREMYTSLTKSQPSGAGPFHVRKLASRLQAVTISDEVMYLAGIKLTVEGADAVVSDVPDLEDDTVHGPWLVVRIDEAWDDYGAPLHGLVQQIIIDGLNDYAAKQTGTALTT